RRWRGASVIPFRLLRGCRSCRGCRRRLTLRSRRTRMLPADAHEAAHVAGVAFEEDLGAAKLALLLARAGAAQVRGQRMVSLELALGGHLETLGDRLVGLELVSHDPFPSAKKAPPRAVPRGRG